jgi:hypothetical protein
MSEHPDMTLADLADWLSELRFQQRQRDQRISEVELYRSFDRYFDALNAVRAQGGVMTNDNPAGRVLIGHVELADTGEIITIHCDDDGSVLLAVYAMSDAEPAHEDADDDVLPAPVVRLSANECETLSGMLAYAAVSTYSHRLGHPTEPERSSTDRIGGGTDA